MRCHLPWTQAFVNANGLVAPCCAPLELGNLADAGIAAVFTGEPYRRLQSDLAAGRRSTRTRHCDDCYALKKFMESGYTFENAHAIGDQTELELTKLEATHPAFVANYRLVRDCYIAGVPLPPHARPIRLEVQLGESCDIRCIMCWQDHERPRALRRETYGEIADLLPYAHNVLFTGGEPTTLRGFWQLVEAFRERAHPQARLQFLTHGQHLAENLGRFEGIPHVGFCVNVDGPDKPTYEHIRSGASWEKLIASLDAVSEALKTHPGWGLNTTFLLMRSNIDRIPETIEFADRFGAQWSCGMITGDYTPVAQCRTYFSENIFRFRHLGYSVEAIVALLEACRVAAARNGMIAQASLEATIQQVRSTRQIEISPERALELARINDNKQLSRQIWLLAVEDWKASRPSIEALATEWETLRGDPDARPGRSAQAAFALGLRQQEHGNLGGAAATLRAGLAIWNRAREGDPARAAEAKLCLARCLAAQGEMSAGPALVEAWSELKEVLGSSHSLSAEAALELGTHLNGDRRFDEAVAPLEEALRTFLRLHADHEDSSYIAVAAHELGVACLESGRLREADRHLRRAARMFDAILGEDNSLSFVAREMLSAASRSQRRPAAAPAVSAASNRVALC